MEQNTEQFPGHDGFAQAAIVMAFLAFIGCRLLFLPMIIASIGIILAILARGFSRTFLPKTKLAIAVGILAIILNMFFNIQSISRSIELYRDPAFREQINEMYENLYGVPLEEDYEFFGGETL